MKTARSPKNTTSPNPASRHRTTAAVPGSAGDPPARRLANHGTATAVNLAFTLSRCASKVAVHAPSTSAQSAGAAKASASRPWWCTSHDGRTQSVPSGAFSVTVTGSSSGRFVALSQTSLVSTTVAGVAVAFGTRMTSAPSRSMSPALCSPGRGTSPSPRLTAAARTAAPGIARRAAATIVRRLNVAAASA